MDWADQKAANLIEAYGAWPELDPPSDSKATRTRRVLATALREAFKRGKSAATKTA